MHLNNEQKEIILNMYSIIIPEILDVALGAKPGMLCGLNAEQAEKIKKIFPGLAVIRGEFQNWSNRANNKHGYAIARSESVARRLLDAESRGSEKEMGRYLGYPDCCIRFWTTEMRVQPWPEVAFAISQRSTKPSFLLNNLFNFSSRLREGPDHVSDLNRYYKKNPGLWPAILHLQFISHIPCAYDCEPSITVAQRVKGLMEAEYPELVRKITEVLKHPLLYFDTFSWAILDGTDNGAGRIRYTGILPPDSLLDGPVERALKEGNEVWCSQDQVFVAGDRKIIFTYDKRNKYDGFIINFG